MHRTSHDNGLEIFDLEENRKWRFVLREGENNGWCNKLLILERKAFVASVDLEATGFWKLRVSEGMSDVDNLKDWGDAKTFSSYSVLGFAVRLITTRHRFLCILMWIKDRQSLTL